MVVHTEHTQACKLAVILFCAFIPCFFSEVVLYKSGLGVWNLLLKWAEGEQIREP